MEPKDESADIVNGIDWHERIIMYSEEKRKLMENGEFTHKKHLELIIKHQV